MAAYQYSNDFKPLGGTAFLDQTPSGFGARIGIAEGEKKGYLLSDQDYYDRFIRGEEEKLLQKGQAAGQAVGRGALIAQGDFMQAQGLGGPASRQARSRACPSRSSLHSGGRWRTRGSRARTCGAGSSWSVTRR